MKPFLHNFLDVLVSTLIVIMFIRAILSWLPNARGKISDFVVQITDPMLNPIRKFVPVTGGVDFAPLVFFFLIKVLHEILSVLIGT
ncbi:MAG: Ycf19 protein [candidate division CPR2 bacterium GW2011_GWC1_39_9]|uniref:Ycf19 protein n=1 Tax=candidate division CPR2 bacterium GW2011_GWC2_39_10 TaxID=1618345 RepID=A0A0G0PAY9_UNCC2|nr:MAG: Ycf19 protein [candidate division CPR2 bacterium GW2011_GWC2_39_10]KKR36066.1 MAG: Ycf19 protein [candidate division CPR2 bacterium GW2011_GWC1_39_9]